MELFDNRVVQWRQAHTVLLTAPRIPAGIRSFQRNLQESGGMGQESTGMRQESAGMTRFLQEWIWIPQESTGMGYFE